MGVERAIKATAATVLIGVGSLIADGVQASTITLEYSNPGSEIVRAQVTCTLGCEARFMSADEYSAGNWGSGVWSVSEGMIVNRNLLSGNNNNDRTRLDLTNLVLGTRFQASDRSETGGNQSTLTSSAEILLVWIGNQDGFRYAFIRNAAADNQISWTGLSGGAGNISGYDGFGVIPLPASGWLLLTALAVLGAAGRRWRKAEA